MRLLVVHPGASWATADVHRGVIAALERQGVEVIQFALDKRIQASAGYLNWCWKHGGKSVVKPTGADAIYLAASGVLERALRFQVDWVLSISSMYLRPEILLLARRAGLKTAVLFTESPYDDEWQLGFAPALNACWVNERSSVEKFRITQPNTFYWQHAHDPQRHNPAVRYMGYDVLEHDVVFVGSGFPGRIKTLEGVDWQGIDLGLYGAWSLLGSRNRLRRHLRAAIIDNRMTSELYRKAKIGINIHRTARAFKRDTTYIESAESLNPRCYELAACGEFFVSDWRAELDDVFAGAVPVFRSSEELERLIRYWLPRDQEREKIGRQLSTLVRQHTFDNRVEKMLATFEEVERNG